jgi:hypothetical protein
LSEITEAAHAEVHDRHPIWRDSGPGVEQAKRFRQGFVDGAEWAHQRVGDRVRTLEGQLKRAEDAAARARNDASTQIAVARAEAKRAQDELITARALYETDLHRLASALRGDQRDALAGRLTDLISSVDIELTVDGDAIVAAPESVAKKILKLVREHVAGDQTSPEQLRPTASHE